jgi:hypothetical protein
MLAYRIPVVREKIDFCKIQMIIAHRENSYIVQCIITWFKLT